MSGYDLLEKMNRLTGLLDAALGAFGRRGKEYAEAEQNYRIALAEKMLELRADGQPVTIVPDLARGDRKIARLKFDRDAKEAVYKAAQEAIQSYKLQMKLTEAQIEREWGKNKC